VRLKKHRGGPHVPYEDVVEEALCFGWVDSRSRKIDSERSALLLTPREPRSAWSRANKGCVGRLIAARLMAPAGLAAVEGARENGAWSALNDVEDLVLPDDLAAAFERHAGSAASWGAFTRSARRGILKWIQQAKRAETRARRIDETARLAAEGEPANQRRPRR
jgi:uncharacterized protein YdeI (YjbR/CyaY-like superfamily)